MNNSITEELVVPESLSTTSCVFKSAQFYTECMLSGRNAIASMGMDFEPAVRVGSFQKGPVESRIKSGNRSLPHLRAGGGSAHDSAGERRRSARKVNFQLLERTCESLAGSFYAGCVNRSQKVKGVQIKAGRTSN